MPWADAGYVLAMTGTAVDDATLARSQGVIDLMSNTTLAASGDLLARPRDLHYLRMALAYQAAWMATQVDLFSRTEIASLTQDGLTMSPGHEDALLLAPLARRALNRLSWRRSRSVRVRAPGEGVDPDTAAALARETRVRDYDDEPWLPL